MTNSTKFKAIKHNSCFDDLPFPASIPHSSDNYVQSYTNNSFRLSLRSQFRHSSALLPRTISDYLPFTRPSSPKTHVQTRNSFRPWPVALALAVFNLSPKS